MGKEPSAAESGSIEYEAEYCPARGSAFQFGFLCVWAVVVVAVISYLASGPVRRLWIGAVAIPLMIMLAITWRISRSGGVQRWIIRDGNVIYETPTPHLGSSFQAKLEEIESIEDRDGDGDFVVCRLRSSGHSYTVDVRSFEGRKFYLLLREFLRHRGP